MSDRFDAVSGGIPWLEGIVPFSQGHSRLLLGTGGSWDLSDLLANVVAELQSIQDLTPCEETNKTLLHLREALLTDSLRKVRVHGTTARRPIGYSPPEGFNQWR